MPEALRLPPFPKAPPKAALPPARHPLPAGEVSRGSGCLSPDSSGCLSRELRLSVPGLGVSVPPLPARGVEERMALTPNFRKVESLLEVCGEQILLEPAVVELGSSGVPESVLEAGGDMLGAVLGR